MPSWPSFFSAPEPPPKRACSRPEVSAEQLGAACPQTPVRWQPLPKTATVDSELERLEQNMGIVFDLEAVNKRVAELGRIPTNISNARAAIVKWEAREKELTDLKPYDAYARNLHDQAKVNPTT